MKDEKEKYNSMKIGELAQRSGFSADTLRWYEKQGLISSERSQGGRNNYRYYDPETLGRLQAIQQMKDLGFTLKEVQELLSLEDIGELHCASITDLVNGRLQLLEEKIQRLQQMHSLLSKAKKACKGDCKEALRGR